MGFSITSAGFGGVIIFSYSLSLSIISSNNRYEEDDNYYEDSYEVYVKKVAIGAAIYGEIQDGNNFISGS